MSYWVIVIPLFFMGVGMPMYYVPLTGLAMGSVREEETASAAGLMNFVRTISGAIATSAGHDLLAKPARSCTTP